MQLSMICISWARAVWIIRRHSRIPSLFIVLTTTPSIAPASFATWMTRIVINLCLDKLRKQKRERAESIENLEEESGGVERQMPTVVVNPTERLERSELRQRIDKALALLS